MSFAIFDLDGLLIDSEPAWRRAEIEVLSAYGVPLTEDMCSQTMGLRVDEVIAYWYERHPWADADLPSVEAALVENVGRRLERYIHPLAGAKDTVEALRRAGWKLAVASSSPLSLIQTSVAALGLADAFVGLCSAVNEAHGKPHPDVYLTAAGRLGADPAHCIAFEDSLVGLRAAKTAGMRVVAVPAPEHFEDPGFRIADWKLRSLKDFDPAIFVAKPN